MRRVSRATTFSGRSANSGGVEAHHILCQLRESIAQDVAGLSLHLYVLEREVESAALASRIAELQRVAAGALLDILEVASSIEEGGASRIGAASDSHTAAKRVNRRDRRAGETLQTKIETSKRANGRVKQPVTERSGSATRSRTSQGTAHRRARTVVDGLSSG